MRTWPRVFDGFTMMRAMEVADELATVRRLLDDLCNEKEMEDAARICAEIKRCLVKASRAAGMMQYSVVMKP